MRRLLVILVLLTAGCPDNQNGVDAGPDGFVDGDGADGGDRLPAPVLETLEPSRGPAEGGTPVVLRGGHFISGASVRFGAVVADGVQVISPSTIEAITPPGSAGPVEVRVTNPDGQYAVLAGGFTYQDQLKGDCPRNTGCQPAEAVFTYSADPADSVLLAGDFTGWRDGAIPMAGDGAGNFEARVTLREGRYEYKFVVNDTDWVNDPAAETEPFFSNSVRYHDNPCTPNLTGVLPAYGEVFAADQATISAAYQGDSDPAEICLVVDGVRRQAVYGAGGITAVLTGLDEGEHHWWMSAADAQGHRSAEVFGMFLVNVSGQPPVADAGPTRFVYAGEWAVLDATGSRDPDGIGISGYSWNQIAGPAVTLEPQHVTPHGGYDWDPLSEPPRTDALMGFSPPSAGTYRFDLTVQDQDGTSTSVTAEVVALEPGAGVRPEARIQVTESAGVVTVDASGSTPGSTFRWYGPGTLPAGGVLSLSEGDLPADGTYFFYVVAQKDGADSLPATAMIKKSGGALSGYDFSAPPDWLYDAQIYEIYARAFADSDGDGVGDFSGLTEKLDYLEDLGVNTLWLMPVFESADHLHGYHTMNYRRVERDYGNNQDLAAFIRAAHQRGMRVVLDLVINHVSRHHPRFQAALDPQSRFHDHFIWFVNHQPTDPLIERYGFGRELGGARLTVQSGWADIPDVNFADPGARDWTFSAARYWMDPDGDGDFSDGVDGFRLDHVTGPDHRVWQNLRYKLKSIRPDLLLLAEVFRDFDNGGQGYGIKDYYRGEFDLAFTFPFYWEAQAVFKDGLPVDERLDGLMTAIDERFRPEEVMCFFIENHDVPWYSTIFLDWGRIEGRMKAACALMQTLPNSPQLLYGQELGTESWRGPMPWAKDTPQNTLKTIYRNFMHLRRDHRALRRGGYLRLPVSGSGIPDVFAFARTGDDETLIVVVNVRGLAIGDVSVDLSPLDATGAHIRDLASGLTWPVTGDWLTQRRLEAYEVWVGILEGG
jgi:glycosidase